MTELSSNTANIVESKTPFNIEYIKNNIATNIGDIFLKKNENSQTTISSVISKMLKYPFLKMLINNPEE